MLRALSTLWILLDISFAFAGETARLVRSPREADRIEGLELLVPTPPVNVSATGSAEATLMMRFEARDRTLVFGVQPLEPKNGVYNLSVPLTGRATTVSLLAASPDGTLKEERIVVSYAKIRKAATAPRPVAKLTDDSEVTLTPPRPTASEAAPVREKEEVFQVKKLGANTDYVAVLFKGMGWQLGDRLCIRAKGRPKACGTVVQRLPGRVRVKYEKPQPPLQASDSVEVTAEYLPRFLASTPDRRVVLSPALLLSSYTRKSTDLTNGGASEIAARLNLGFLAGARVEWTERFDTDLAAMLMRDNFVPVETGPKLQDGEQTLFGINAGVGYRLLENRTLRLFASLGLHEQSVLKAINLSTIGAAKSWVPRAGGGLGYLLILGKSFVLDFRGAAFYLFSGAGTGYDFKNGSVLEASLGGAQLFEGWSLGARVYMRRTTSKTSIVDQTQSEAGVALTAEQRL